MQTRTRVLLSYGLIVLDLLLLAIKFFTNLLTLTPLGIVVASLVFLMVIDITAGILYENPQANQS